MKKYKDFDFEIPDYVASEMEEYEELKQQGVDTFSKKINVITLLNLARFNNRITDEQVEQVINTYFRE